MTTTSNGRLNIRTSRRPPRLPRAEPKALDVGAIVRACITTGTPFAQQAPATTVAWLGELGEIIRHRLASVALTVLPRQTEMAELAKLPNREDAATWTAIRMALEQAARRDAIVSLGADHAAADDAAASWQAARTSDTSGSVRFARRRRRMTG